MRSGKGKPKSLKGLTTQDLQDLYRVELDEVKFLEDLDKWESNNSLDVFARKYFDHYFDCKTPDFHHEIDAILQDESTRKAAIAAPRGFAKSVKVSLIFVLREVLTLRRKFVILLSDSSDQAEDLLRHIKKELEENELLRDDFGVQVGHKWSDKNLVLQNGARIMALGARKKIRGRRERHVRPDLIIIDDLENDEHVRSKTRRNYLKRWFHSAVLNALDPVKGRIIVIGTILHRYSLLNGLLDDGKWESRKYSAIVKEPGKPDRSLWEDRLPLPALEEIRARDGDAIFCMEMLNDPTAIENAPFKKEWLRYWNRLALTQDGEPVFDIVGAIDPAVKKTERADWFVFVTLGRSRKTRAVYLLDLYRAKSTALNHMREIFRRHRRFQHAVIGIETNKEAFLREWIDEYGQELGLYLNLEGIHQVRDKILRITTGLQPLFQNRRFYCHEEKHKDFIEEYECFPDNTEHDDILDAVEMGLRMFARMGSAVSFLGED